MTSLPWQPPDVEPYAAPLQGCSGRGGFLTPSVEAKAALPSCVSLMWSLTVCFLPCSAVAEGPGPNPFSTVDAAAGDSERVMRRHSSISGRPSASATVIPSASALGPQPVLRSTLKHKVPNRSVTHEALGGKKTRDNKATLLQDLLLQVRVSALKCCLPGLISDPFALPESPRQA